MESNLKIQQIVHRMSNQTFKICKKIPNFRPKLALDRFKTVTHRKSILTSELNLSFNIFKSKEQKN